MEYWNGRLLDRAVSVPATTSSELRVEGQARTQGRTERRLINRDVCLFSLAMLLSLSVLAAAVFGLAPNVDLTVSRLFSGTSGSFPMQTQAGPRVLRGTMMMLTDGTMLALAATGAASLFWWFRVAIHRRVTGFCLMVHVFVPGVVVNGLLKSHWGRARPRDIVEFGGTAAFTAPLVPADQCASNCSFVSGEASALVTVATLALLFVVPLLGRNWRYVAQLAIMMVAVTGSLLRVAVGAHFLSDVVFAALLSSSLVLVLYVMFGMDRIADPILRRPPAFTRTVVLPKGADDSF